MYPSGVSSDGFNKLSPYQQSSSDRPVSTNYSDVSSVYGRPQYHHQQQGYAPAPMVPVQEMDASAVAPPPPPQELGTGQEHGVVQVQVQVQDQVEGETPSPLSRGNTGYAQ